MGSLRGWDEIRFAEKALKMEYVPCAADACERPASYKKTRLCRTHGLLRGRGDPNWNRILRGDKRVKECSSCGLIKPRAQFYTYTRVESNGKEYIKSSAACIQCSRTLHYRNYGLTAGDYEAMLEDQEGGCAICGDPSPSMQLAIDHNHDTGEVRGLLCANCNKGLGNFKDSPRLLAAAAYYLVRKRDHL